MFRFLSSAQKHWILVMLASIPFSVFAQSDMIKDVFKLLPSTYTFDLNSATKDSMLDGKIYYPADNDRESVVAFNYGNSIFVKDYMYVSMSYETSQRASAMVELRGFKMGGKIIIVVSGTGGVEGINYQQNSISTFIYSGNKTLIPYEGKALEPASVNDFLKVGIPRSVKDNIVNNANLIFDISNSDVVLSLNSSFLLENQEYRKWLKGDRIKYRWTGKRFIAGPFYNSNQIVTY